MQKTVFLDGTLQDKNETVYQDLESCPLLIYGNKQDIVNHEVRKDVIIERLGLDVITNREWHIQICSAVTGVGLREGLEWYHKLKQ